MPSHPPGKNDILVSQSATTDYGGRTDRIRVYVAGPYSGNTEENTRTAIDNAQAMLDQGFAPLVPHLTHYWDTLYHKNPWETWLELDLPWVAQADCVYRLPGESKGADIEVGYAKGLGIPVYYDFNRLVEKGKEWRSSAAGAERSNPSPSSSQTTAPETEGATDANPATRPDTLVGNVPTNKRSLDTTVSGIRRPTHGSPDTGSPEHSTCGFWTDRGVPAPSVTSLKQSSSVAKSDPSTSTTIMQEAMSAVCSVLSATRESESSKIIRLDFKAPPNMSPDLRFYSLLAEIGLLHLKKQADYGGEGDPFANVRASHQWGIPPWVGALVRLSDKVRRLQTFARTHHLTNEGAQDSLSDIAVYALISSILLKEEEKQ